MADDKLMACLQKAGLYTLSSKFIDEKIEIETITHISDNELARLGVGTIGDRIRLRECAKEQLISTSVEDVAASIEIHPRRFRNALFNSRPAKQGKPKKKRNCGWTGQFVCLADNTQERIPAASEKEVLRKAGLGLKKIRLDNDATEEMVIQKLMCPEIPEDGFPQLKEAGGFEFTRTMQSGRQLSVIDSPWSSSELKAKVGPQARIYIRPIQKSLTTTPKNENNTSSTVREPCRTCGNLYLLNEMRTHVETCLEFHQIHDPGSSRTYVVYESLDESSLNNVQLDTIHTESSLNNVQLDTIHTELELPAIDDSNINVEIDFGSNETFQEDTNINTVTGNIITDNISQADSLNIDLIIEQCRALENPVEILKKLQQEIVSGRPLEVTDESVPVEGETNYIFVDREHVLETGMDEIKEIVDLRKTLEVQFYNENAVDLGGPRKEFFRLIMMAIKEKYFDNGLRDLLCDDYKTVGIIFALSTLQNGKIPTFINDQHLDELFTAQDPSPCIENLRTGFNSLGLVEVGKELPAFRFLFHPTAVKLTYKKMTQLVQPTFSEAGSNQLQYEKTVYSAFLRYLRAVASGRREGTTLEKVLQFVTSADDEPVLGFRLQPTIIFVEATSFLPTANTCVNRLQLTRPSHTVNLPDDTTLFQLFDYAFCNSFFGLQ